METSFRKAKILMVTSVIAAIFISQTTFLPFSKAQVNFVPTSPAIGAKVSPVYISA